MTTFSFMLLTQDGQRHAASTSFAPTDDWTKKWLSLDGFLGAHVYARKAPGGGIEVGIRLSNGCVRANGSGFKGRLYYNTLAFTVDDATIRIANGGGHVFPPRGVLERRYTITNGQVVRGWSYADAAFPDPAQPFGPAREALPPINRAHYAGIYATLRDQLKAACMSGTKVTLYPWGTNGPAPEINVQTNRLGPYMPDGYPAGDAPAGYGIAASVGWEQCVESLQFACFAHECAMDRNPVAAFNPDTGDLIRCTDWTSNYLAHGQTMKGEPAPQANKLELPAFLVGDYNTFHYPNANEGTCPYQAALEAYQPDNTEHVIRAMRRACALVGWAADPMAQDDLDMLFEYHRTLWFGNRADDKTHASDGSYVPPSLSALLYYANTNPGVGAPVLRSFGWIMWLGAWANAPSDWAQDAIDAYLQMVDRFGLPQREAHLPYIPAGWQGTQHFHSVLIHIGAWTLARAANYREREVLTKIGIWGHNVLQNAMMPLQERPDGPGSFGPPKWIFTQGPDGEVADLTLAESSGPNSGFQEHVLALLGRAALSAKEFGMGTWQRSLTAGLGVDLPTTTLPFKLAQMRAHQGEQSQYSIYWAMLEQVNQ